MARLVIFGAGDVARLAHHYFTHDSPHEVAGFVVDRAFRSGDEFLGLPFADAEDVTNGSLQASTTMFVAISYAHMNAVRAEKYATMKAAGYQLLSYVSSGAAIFRRPRLETTASFSRTTPFSHLSPSATT